MRQVVIVAEAVNCNFINARVMRLCDVHVMVVKMC